LKPFDEREVRTVIEMALYKHEAESRLRASERRFAVTLSSIGDAVIATDDQAQIDFLNPIAVQLTGWSRAEACGRPIGEVFRIVDEYSREPASDPVAEALRWGRVARLKGRTVLLARDGRETPIDDSGAPIIADDGSVTGRFWSSRTRPRSAAPRRPSPSFGHWSTGRTMRSRSSIRRAGAFST
jgi:PAS domain S-box-containing protein